MLRIFTTLRSYLIALYLKFNHISYGSIPKFSGYWPKFNNQGRIILGKKCRFREYHIRQVISVIDKDAILEIGEHCFLSDGVNICASKKITIGAYTQLAPSVSIYDTDFHEIQEAQKVFQSEINIGRNTWIGQNTIIMPGVTIGDHTVIGANSVVTKDIPSKVIAVGSPARVIKNIICNDDWIRL